MIVDEGFSHLIHIDEFENFSSRVVDANDVFNFSSCFCVRYY